MLLLEGVGVLQVVPGVALVEAQAHHLVPGETIFFKFIFHKINTLLGLAAESVSVDIESSRPGAVRSSSNVGGGRSVRLARRHLGGGEETTRNRKKNYKEEQEGYEVY